MSLERNAPVRLSSPGAPAFAPAISGKRVVWESKRDLDGEELGLELFARDWTSGEELRVVSAPGDQHAARVSGDRLAWLDTRNHPSEVRTCRLESSRAPCRDTVAAAGPDSRRALDLSQDLLVWTQGESGVEQLRGCRASGAGCPPIALPQSAASQIDPVVRGGRLWWRELFAGGAAVYTCAGIPGSCEPAVLDSVQTDSPFAATESRAAWWSLGFPSRVSVCRMTGAGTCSARLITTVDGLDIEIAISEHRVVWHAPGPGGDLDIYFCEDDAHTGQCPVQRLTGSAAEQRNPDVSGTRVVWEDDRDGPAILGLELPSLDPIPDRSATVGRTLRIAVRGRDPAGGVLALTGAFADGTPLAARGAQFVDRGDGSGVLSWTPRAGDAGTHIVTFAGRSAGHLTTRTSVRIAVSSPRAAP